MRRLLSVIMVLMISAALLVPSAYAHRSHQYYKQSSVTIKIGPEYSSSYKTRCQYYSGYWHKGHWIAPKKVCTQWDDGYRYQTRYHKHYYKNCYWTGGYWHGGVYYPYQKVCRY